MVMGHGWHAGDDILDAVNGLATDEQSLFGRSFVLRKLSVLDDVSAPKPASLRRGNPCQLDAAPNVRLVKDGVMYGG